MPNVLVLKSIITFTFFLFFTVFHIFGHPIQPQKAEDIKLSELNTTCDCVSALNFAFIELIEYLQNTEDYPLSKQVSLRTKINDVAKHCVLFLEDESVEDCAYYNDLVQNASKANLLYSLQQSTQPENRLQRADTGIGSPNFTEIELDKNEVYVHLLADPGVLFPPLSFSASASYIEPFLFQSLLIRNSKTMELEGGLAIGRPIIKQISTGEWTGGMSLTYEIRPEAKWDNGTPVLASDLEFTLKAINNPKVETGHLKNYVNMFKHISIDPDNPRKFTLFTPEQYILAEEWSGYYVLPEYVYDPNGFMQNYTLRQLTNEDKLKSIQDDKSIIEFARLFNSIRDNQSPESVSGSGAYRLVKRENRRKIVLERKENWWADQINNQPHWLTAYPDRIIYRIKSDMSLAILGLKGQVFDVMTGIRPLDFVRLADDKKFLENYHLYSPLAYSYTYIGLNMRNSILSDVNVRRALAYLIDKQKIIDNIIYGLAIPSTGPVHPTKAYFYEDENPISFDIEKAKQLLAESGWKDLDGDGFLNKIVDGEKIRFKLTLLYNAGNDIRRTIGLLLKENAKKVGIDINVESKEWTVFIEKTRNHNFDLFCGGWMHGTELDDPMQIWHSSAQREGSNYVGFGSDESDRIIEAIRKELNPERRNQLYRKFQEMVRADVPYIFLYVPKNLIAIHKRWDNAMPSKIRPGFNLNYFRLNPEYSDNEER